MKILKRKRTCLVVSGKVKFSNTTLFYPDRAPTKFPVVFVSRTIFTTKLWRNSFSRKACIFVTTLPANIAVNTLRFRSKFFRSYYPASKSGPNLDQCRCSVSRLQSKKANKTPHDRHGLALWAEGSLLAYYPRTWRHFWKISKLAPIFNLNLDDSIYSSVSIERHGFLWKNINYCWNIWLIYEWNNRFLWLILG